MVTTHTVRVSGATLHYEVRGSGPALVVTGAPMDASAFAMLADALASRFTVITNDPRGISGSKLDDPTQESTPDLRADDIVAILDDLGIESADVFGSSGGAVTGLAMVSRHPARVRTLVAHEPPLLELLPDAAEHRAATEDLIETFHRDGQAAAWMKFMANAGFVGEDGEPATLPFEPTEQDIANGERFFAYELRNTALYQPDIEALKNSEARIVVGIGAESGGLSTYRTSVALAKLLGVEPVEFPGDHGGFLGQPKVFAEALSSTLSRVTA